MTKKPLADHLSALIALSPELANELRQIVNPESFRPKQLWHAGKNVPSKVWYVEEGLFHAYYLNEKGESVTTSFFQPGDFILLYENHGPGNGSEYLEALQPALLQSITFVTLGPLLARHPELNLLVAYVLRAHHNREVFRMRLLEMTAAVRYRKFRKTYPHLFSLVPLRLIASYLNMTRENLSRLIGKDR